MIARCSITIIPLTLLSPLISLPLGLAKLPLIYLTDSHSYSWTHYVVLSPSFFFFFRSYWFPYSERERFDLLQPSILSLSNTQHTQAWLKSYRITALDFYCSPQLNSKFTLFPAWKETASLWKVSQVTGRWSLFHSRWDKDATKRLPILLPASFSLSLFFTWVSIQIRYIWQPLLSWTTKQFPD